ncbi:MAG TPA: FecR family protein [Gammaproteobacteria bacterium]|nr:FecR family protein [Gammaproteobacteria bacterium]
MRPVSKIALPLVVLASGLGAAVPAWTESDASQQGSKDIVVEQLGGAVEVTVADVAFNARVGSSLGLPARIVTGSDGNIAIRQSRTGVAIAPDSDVEIPAAARDGQLIARMIQHRGTAFYDVEPRPVEKLRIETPYLVAVVKGTQFSVLVQDGRTTVSLLEGLLELRSIDDAEVVDLAAGQIAVGTLGGGIQVLPMDADLLPEAAALGQDASIGSVASLSIASTGTGTGIDAEASLSVGGGLDAGADLGGGSVDVGLDAGLDSGVEVEADLGLGDVEIGAGLDADLGLGELDVDDTLEDLLDPGYADDIEAEEDDSLLPDLPLPLF